MKEITEAFDTWLAAEFDHTMKLWGYSELMTRSGQVMPVTIPDREQVSLNNNYDLITWIRVPGPIQMGNEIEGNDWSFGLQKAIVQTTSFRIVLAHKTSIGEDFIVDFLKALPNTLDVDGYSFVSINKPTISVDADHEGVYNTELGSTVTERHRFDWNVYAISVPVDYVSCTVTSPD